MMEFYRGVLLFNTMNSLREWSSVTVPFGDSERFHHYTMDWDEVFNPSVFRRRADERI